jgi:2-C-methyl-D-erythritol 2,4-cyclodiphosphate synthase
VIRFGLGIDVHPFAEGRRLILAGTELPSEVGLVGHSDADVLSHAVMDALLGAAGLGDIGQLFPDTDPAYAGANSLELLRKVGEMVRQRGFVPLQVDCTILAQKPRLTPYYSVMRDNLAEALGLSPDVVSVKATTTEGLGFLGRAEGMAAVALAVIAKSEVG